MFSKCRRKSRFKEYIGYFVSSRITISVLTGGSLAEALEIGRGSIASSTFQRWYRTSTPSTVRDVVLSTGLLWMKAKDFQRRKKEGPCGDIVCATIFAKGSDINTFNMQIYPL